MARSRNLSCMLEASGFLPLLQRLLGDAINPVEVDSRADVAEGVRENVRGVASVLQMSVRVCVKVSVAMRLVT